MKILFVGGTGTLSNCTLTEALNENNEVSVLNRGNRMDLIPSGVVFYKGDFYDCDSWAAQLKDKYFDVVIDFLSRKPSDIRRVFPFFKNRCKQYIFISTACVYRRNIEDLPIKETSPKPNTLWSYNTEKYESEKELIRLSRESAGCHWTIARPYITYDNARIPFAFTPPYKHHRTILERIRAGKPMFVWNEGRTMTTLTYVHDFAQGLKGLFMNEEAMDTDFHITGDFTCTWKEFWQTLYSKLKLEPNVINVSPEDINKYLPNYAEMFAGDRSLDAVFDNTKIKETIPTLRFRYNLEQGINKVLEYYENASHHNYDYAYDAQVDRMLARYSQNTHYVKYPNAKKKSYFIYFIYRHFNYRIAQILCRKIRMK